MKKLTACLLLLFSLSVFAQKNDATCNCPVLNNIGIPPYPLNTKATRTFHLPNNTNIILCGYTDTSVVKGKALFSEFTLSECGTNDVLGFWGAVLSCNVKVNNDTLLVERLEPLPIGKSMKTEFRPWTTERIYYVNAELVNDIQIDPRIPKYTTSQIASVLKLYSRTPNKNNDSLSELADKLLICVLSGSKEAERYLLNFKNKFTMIDGEVEEGYDTTLRMLKFWETHHYDVIKIDSHFQRYY